MGRTCADQGGVGLSGREETEMAAGIRRSLIAAVLLALAATACTGASASEPEPAEADVPASEYEDFDGPTFISPELGDVVSGTVDVEIDPGSVDPTGETTAMDYKGRFHVLVDQGCAENGDPMPVGEEGHHSAELDETTVSLDLEPGAHELCLQFANGYDVAFYSTDTITIRVED